jgi:hypothetical protein
MSTVVRVHHEGVQRYHSMFCVKQLVKFSLIYACSKCFTFTQRSVSKKHEDRTNFYQKHKKKCESQNHAYLPYKHKHPRAHLQIDIHIHIVDYSLLLHN